MESFMLVLVDLFAKVPGWIDAGIKVEGLVEGAIKSWRQVGTTVSPDDPTRKALDAVVDGYDNDFDAAYAARLGEAPPA